jgi:hypothetical protein
MEMDEKLDNDIDKTISTKCIKGHKFKVPREKITTSSTGKSFITLCPKCNSVSRLRREDVFELYGINPRDHVAVGNLYASLAAGGTPVQGETTPMPPQVVEAPPRGAPVPFVGDNDIAEDEDEEDEDEEDEDEEDEDEEYTAIVESAPDITGKKKTVQRFRVAPEDDEEDDDDDSYSRNKTPVKSAKKAPKPVKKARRPVRREEEYEDEEMEEDEEEQPRRRGTVRSMKNIDEDEFDPNEVLMDLIEESGLDANTIDRIADYVYMQPDGWQPAAIQGVLAMYLTPSASQKIAQRYQAELYKEEKRREKERAMLNLMGSPSGNMRLFDRNNGANFSPMSQPLQGGFPPQQGFPGQQFPQQGFPGQQFPQQPFPQQPFPQQTFPQADAYRAPAPRGVTAYETEKLIDAKLDVKFKELTEALLGSKREEAAAAEAREMRNLVFELLKERTNQPAAATNPPLVTELIKAQGGLVDTLLKTQLERKQSSPMDDPLMKILVQELLSSKKSTGVPLTNTSEELGQRIQLQRLANELELAQADFRDKQEGRAFTRDLASQALSKIGEAAASAYIETQRIQAEAAKYNATQERIARVQGVVPSNQSQQPQQQVATVKAVESSKSKETPTEPQGTVPAAESMHKVKAVPDELGNIILPCPTCGSDMKAHVGDKQVICPVCRTEYNASVPVPVPIPSKLPEKVPDKMPEPIVEPHPIIEPEQVIEPAPPVVEPVPFLDPKPEPEPEIVPVEETTIAEASVKKSPRRAQKSVPKKSSSRKVVIRKTEEPLAQ